MEKKSKKGAEVLKPEFKASMNEANAAEELTYEQLKQVASGLKAQCDQLYQKLREAHNIISNFNDIGLLISIIEKSEYFSEDFIGRCTSKVEEVVTRMLDSADKQETEN